MDAYYIKLIRMGARWCDPQNGRWISPDTIVPDPANPQNLNRYAYVLGNPVLLHDPSGHRPCGEYCPGESLDGSAERGQYYHGNWDIREQERNEAAVADAVSLFIDFGQAGDAKGIAEAFTGTCQLSPGMGPAIFGQDGPLTDAAHARLLAEKQQAEHVAIVTQDR
jgi:RHS repeat-associated protein